jgi:glycosyltransferase involved in cell wall biosynthesis
VTAVYDVERYLPDFIASIERQRFDPSQLEVVAVDDGSTDGSLELLQRWADRRPDLVKVARQPNGGAGAARNRGLDLATGEWVTFSDPDDMLDPGYLAAADRFASKAPGVEVMAARPVLLMERTGRLSDSHPRRRQFERGDRVVDLDEEPNVFTGSAAVSFFRLDHLRGEDLRFDPRIRPNFEDGHFAARYLLSLPRPIVGIVREASYVYRKRATGDSTLQTSYGHQGRYTDVLRHGYLDILDRARRLLGAIPEWLAQVIVYELSWYLSEDEKASSAVRLAPESELEFHTLFAQVIRQLDPAVVARHAVRPLRPVWRDILGHGCREAAWHEEAIARTRIDAAAGLMRLQYRFVGSRPAERFEESDIGLQPRYQKTMAHRYFGRPLIEERIIWLPFADRLTARLDELVVPIRSVTDARDRWKPVLPASDDELRGRSSDRRGMVSPGRRVAGRLRRLDRVVLRWVARFGPIRERNRSAWVLMDRIYMADDNAERLFEYLRVHRPDINAWFVIERGTPDWYRLRRAYGRRVIAHGGLAWRLLMTDCAWLVSSHADRAIADHPRLRATRASKPPRTAFLQHGVIKDDLSRWLNPYEFDLFIVSTEAELASVVDDGTGYVYTAHETQLTGLPRFDRLLAKAADTAPGERDLVLVAPTWRSWLTAPGDPATQRRPVDDAVWSSRYLEQWVGLIRSSSLARAAAAHGLTVAFMPHPNIQPVLDRIRLPDHVRALTFDREDVQSIYARTALLVTDYSSVAFNAAYIDVPVVYFQFDIDEVRAGAHLGRAGYFDYERDGFGPVAYDLDSAVGAAVAAIDAGPRPGPEYRARAERAFPVRDGRACERVVAAIESFDRPAVEPG